jgi:hypothetical protein
MDCSAATEATYSVPVPAALEPYASYELKNFQWQETRDSVEVTYKLPELLLGYSHRVSFRGRQRNDGHYELVSDQYGKLECTKDENGHDCRAMYRGLKVDLPKVEALLVSKNVESREREGRMAVSARFGGDLVGVIHVPAGER